MKGRLLQKLQHAPRLRRRDLWLTILPAIYWLLALNARTWMIKPYCMTNPAICSPAHVPAIDRPGIGLDSGDADGFSLITQNTSGIMAVAVSMAWDIAQIGIGAASARSGLAALGTDLVLLGQGIAWNGAFTETARLLAGRPRPFVYSNRSQAADVQNYTSFYSGHTSFSAVTCVTLLLILIGRGAPTWLLLLAGIAGQSLVISTAVFRILSGRHFLTDTLIGAAMGALVALSVARFHRPNRSP